MPLESDMPWQIVFPREYFLLLCCELGKEELDMIYLNDFKAPEQLV